MKVPESKFQFVPFEFPSSPDGQYFIDLDNAGVLCSVVYYSCKKTELIV